MGQNHDIGSRKRYAQFISGLEALTKEQRRAKRYRSDSCRQGEHLACYEHACKCGCRNHVPRKGAVHE